MAFAPFYSQTVSFTTATTGAVIGIEGSIPAFVSIQAKGTGAAATTWSVSLQGSLDGANWTTILTHANADTDGTVKFAADSTPRPVMFLRLNCTSLALGSATAVVVTFVATPA